MNNARKAAVLEKLASVMDKVLKLGKRAKKLAPKEEVDTVAFLKKTIKSGDHKTVKGVFNQ